MKRMVTKIRQKYATINFVSSLLFCIVALKFKNESSKWLLIYSLIQQVTVLFCLMYRIICKKQFKENIVGLIEDFTAIYITVYVFLYLFSEYYVYSKIFMAIGCCFPFLLGTSKEWVKKQEDKGSHHQSGNGSLIGKEDTNAESER